MTNTQRLLRRLSRLALCTWVLAPLAVACGGSGKTGAPNTPGAASKPASETERYSVKAYYHSPTHANSLIHFSTLVKPSGDSDAGEPRATTASTRSASNFRIGQIRDKLEVTTTLDGTSTTEDLDLLAGLAGGVTTADVLANIIILACAFPDGQDSPTTSPFGGLPPGDEAFLGFLFHHHF